MKKIGFTYVAVAAIFIALTVEPRAAGANVWSKPVTLKVIYPRIFPLGGNSFPTFEFRTNSNPLNDNGTVQTLGTTCGETTAVGLRGVDGPTYDIQMRSLQSMQSGLFAAFMSGKRIRIRWDGSLCYANEIVLCSDDACSNF